ncbi:MAG: universal stress protein [Cyclobacteriaceae bacterium]
MKRILVPCDFSKASQEAFKMAVGLAAKANGKITVLHVIYISTIYDPNSIGDAGFSQPFFDTMEEDAEKAFEKLKKEHSKNTPIELETTVGGLIESITRVTEEKNIELVVMGTSGSSGIEEFVIGSNTEKIVRFSKVPVLAVRKATDVIQLKQILLPTTGDLDQTEFIAKVKELQRFLNARLHILLINTPSAFMRDAEGKERLEEFAKHYQLNDYELHFRSYRKEEEGIIDFAQSNDIDLIVMATHSRKGLAHLFTGSVTEGVVNHIQSPVWTFSVKK